MSTEFFVRIIGLFVFGGVGWWIGVTLSDPKDTTGYYRNILSLIALGVAVGLVLTPYVTVRPIRRIRQGLQHIPAHDLFAGIIGLIIGLAVSALLALPLSMLPEPFNRVLPLCATLLFGYLGIAILVMRQKDLFALWEQRSWPGFVGGGSSGDYVLLDTSAIIDGRIADISQTGFIRGTMLIPRFVLNELQHIADSADLLRRNRGRRGLDILNRLQKESAVPIQISEVDIEGAMDVDSKLIQLARQLHCPIITNDFNLNRVAEIQGIPVLNINELANAVKSVVLPGEELTVRVIQEGKEMGQGIGYLDDGTMVVVENGRRYIGQQLEVIVTRVLQTVAGRMIFAHIKAE